MMTKILFVGGGTLGPVTPLLAVARSVKRLKPDASFVWIGTPDGPERALVEAEGIPFRDVPVAKWPRYASLRWFAFPLDWARARRSAKRAVAEIAPDAVVTAGGFTAVPIIYAAAKFAIPCFTHQLDLVPGLSNRRIARFCRSVTTSFEYERAPFGDWVNDERIATPARFQLADMPSRPSACKTFGLDPKRPVTLVFGGGTGAQALNDLLCKTREAWLRLSQVIHVTGLGKEGCGASKGYVEERLLDGRKMLAAYAAADLVVCRAGMGALAEIAALKKAAILAPMPKSHQEYNARAFEERGAVVIARQEAETFADDALAAADLLLKDADERRAMGERAHAFLPTDDGTAFAKRILRDLGFREEA